MEAEAEVVVAAGDEVVTAPGVHALLKEREDDGGRVSSTCSGLSGVSMRKRVTRYVHLYFSSWQAGRTKSQPRKTIMSWQRLCTPVQAEHSP